MTTFMLSAGLAFTDPNFNDATTHEALEKVIVEANIKKNKNKAGL